MIRNHTRRSRRMSDIVANERVSLATTGVQMRSTRRIKHVDMVLPEQNDTVVYTTSKTDNTLQREQLTYLNHVVMKLLKSGDF